MHVHEVGHLGRAAAIPGRRLLPATEVTADINLGWYVAGDLTTVGQIDSYAGRQPGLGELRGTA